MLTCILEVIKAPRSERRISNLPAKNMKEKSKVTAFESDFVFRRGSERCFRNELGFGS
jgi:hypothetical protein